MNINNQALEAQVRKWFAAMGKNPVDATFSDKLDILHYTQHAPSSTNLSKIAVLIGRIVESDKAVVHGGR